MIVLSEAVEQVPSSASSRENKVMTEAAKIVGCQVYYIPPDFERCVTAENALYHIPRFTPEVPGVWIGYIPEVGRYEAIYQAARNKGIKLLNSPQQHRIGMEFDLFYPLLGELTPKSVTIRSIDECATATDLLGFPVFVKGAIQSKKKQGWQACVANNLEELVKLTTWLLQLKYVARGRVIVRKLVNLRHENKLANGLPIGREFRVVLYQEEVIKYGYYWDGQDSLDTLSPEEEKEVLDLAVLAAQRLNIPYVAIDIGQLVTEEWLVIEISDAQFAGLNNIPKLEFWHHLKELV